MRCPVCNFYAKTERQLVEHRRQEHPGGPNARAILLTLESLGQDGRVEGERAALVQAVISLAESLDADPGNANLWRVYRESVTDLARIHGDADDGLAQALAEITRAGAVGDPAKT